MCSLSLRLCIKSVRTLKRLVVLGGTSLYFCCLIYAASTWFYPVVCCHQPGLRRTVYPSWYSCDSKVYYSWSKLWVIACSSCTDVNHFMCGHTESTTYGLKRPEWSSINQVWFYSPYLLFYLRVWIGSSRGFIITKRHLFSSFLPSFLPTTRMPLHSTTLDSSWSISCLINASISL